VAFLIGTIEIFGLLSGELHIHGGFCDFMAAGPQRLHLAQLNDRRTSQALLDRLRPLMTCAQLPVNDLESWPSPFRRS
jgi:hypothetical protein